MQALIHIWEFTIAFSEKKTHTFSPRILYKDAVLFNLKWSDNKEYILVNNYKTEVKYYTECTLIKEWINPWNMLPEGITKIIMFFGNVWSFGFWFAFFLMGVYMCPWISHHFAKDCNKGQNIKNQWENKASIVSQPQSTYVSRYVIYTLRESLPRKE